MVSLGSDQMRADRPGERETKSDALKNLRNEILVL